MNQEADIKVIKSNIDKDILLKAYRLMCTAKRMSETYDEHKDICSKYVHSTSRGHEAIQLAAGLQLKPFDYASLYYRDDSILLGLGLQPHELMMQLMAKKNDPFTGGRSYYGHPALKKKGFPTIPHQSSATGMQAIPATGMAHAIHYLESQGLGDKNKPIVLCSMGDGSITEGEVAEAFQMAILNRLPIIYMVQDNDWSISVSRSEMRAMDAYEYAAGFKGLKRMRVDGSDFEDSYLGIKKAIAYARSERAPVLIHAKCPLLGHHTSGVRKEWYRGEKDLKKHAKDDPVLKLKNLLSEVGFTKKDFTIIQNEVSAFVAKEYQKALHSEDPDISDFNSHEFAPTPVTEEKGNRKPVGGEKVVMVDAALSAVDDILKNNPESLFYGQDVGKRLGGVFREAATLAAKHGEDRVFNTPIQEAYIIGSTAGMSAVGAKPIVEIQFADYIWPGINQLVEELSKSCYLTKGKFPVQALIRIPIGAYGGGGPYHSGSIESAVLSIRGIKVIYPSNAADIKGLMKAAFLDPNPVICFEHKGLYWSKVPGTDGAKTIEPDEDYIIPLGKANIIQHADQKWVEEGQSAVVITYGMGVWWAKAASETLDGKIEILDLRTLNPIDWQAIADSVKKHSRALLLTEEQLLNSFTESVAGRIAGELFEYLDAPVKTLGAVSLPAIPLNVELEKQMLPNAEKTLHVLEELLSY
ncbi:MAG: tungsten formylmethanofuran dehydrogenase [Bacteroidetes bacterium]|nr:tungsten formylmethanofuran dehydrogenase [Bacteroidota bacterium]